MWITLYAVVLSVHGIGHVLGLFPALGIARLANWTGDSPVVVRLAGERLSMWLGALLWLVAGLGFVLASAALFGWAVPLTSFATLALGSSVLSLAALFLYPHGFPTIVNKVGALAVNIFTIATVTYFGWP